MNLRKFLALGVVPVAAGALTLAPSALSASTPMCSGTWSTNTTGDLVVPSGKTCTINPGVTIGHDVDVDSGATLIDNGATITHDIQATSPKGIGIGGSASGMGFVGNDIQVTGATGSASNGNNYLCDTEVGADVQISGTTSKAGQWVIGDIYLSCSRGGNQIGNNLQVASNAVPVAIANNEAGTSPYMVGIGNDLQLTGNLVTKTSPIVQSNYIGNTGQCQKGTTTDSHFTPNIFGVANQGCPA